jgi:hypothetical protein
MKQTQICIALSRNAASYLDFLLTTIKQTENIDRFQFLLGINHDVNSQEIRNIVDNHKIDAVIIDANPGNSYGSSNHGLALDILFSHVTAEYCIMADVDIAFVCKNWFEKFLACLNDKCVIVGTEYDGPKYFDFPNVICAMFKTAVVKEAGVLFKPEGHYLTIDEHNASIYSRTPGDVILLDTGSELPRKLKTAGYMGNALKLHRTSSDKAIVVKGIRGEEYHLNNCPILTHIGRSYTRQFGKHEDAIAWEKAVRKFNELL